MTTENYSSMDDDAFEEALTAETAGQDEGAPDTDEATTQGDEETPAEEEEGEEGQQEAEEEAPEESEDDGPGDRKVALQREREARRQAEARAKAAEEEAKAYREAVEAQRQAQEAAIAQQEEARIAEHYNALVDEGREDEAREFLQRVQAHKADTLKQQHSQQLQRQALSMSASMMREIHGQDFEARIQRAYEVYGADAFDALAMKNNPQAPAKWAYEFSKKHLPTEADLEALAEEKAKAKLAAATAKNQPPSTRGPKTIGHISTDTQNPGAKKPIRKMSDAELERSLLE